MYHTHLCFAWTCLKLGLETCLKLEARTRLGVCCLDFTVETSGQSRRESSLMNSTAQVLVVSNSHFNDVNGWFFRFYHRISTMLRCSYSYTTEHPVAEFGTFERRLVFIKFYEKTTTETLSETQR